MFLFWITTIIIIVIAYRQEQHQQPWLLFLLGQAQKEVEVAGGVEEMQRTAIESAANACRLMCMFCQF